MVKQWLNEYSSGLSGTSRQISRLRQLRLNSLERWRVKEIVSTLPVLLQIALALFFAGLLVLLWTLNHTVAAVSTAFIGVLAVFSAFTVILPSLVTQCCYLSPPSRALFEFSRMLRRCLYVCRCHLTSWILQRYDVTWPHFGAAHPHVYRVWRRVDTCGSVAPLTWHGRELFMLQDGLDGDMVAAAYTATMDTDYLCRAAVCTTEMSLSATRRCFKTIRSANIAQWGEDDQGSPMELVHPSLWSATIIAFMTISGGDNTAWSPSSLAVGMKTVYDYIDSTLTFHNIHTDISQTRLLCVDISRILRHYDHGRLPVGSPNFEKLLVGDYRLVWFVQAITGMDVGNDVRQYSECPACPAAHMESNHALRSRLYYSR